LGFQVEEELKLHPGVFKQIEMAMDTTVSVYLLMQTDLAHVRLDEELPHLPGTGELDILLEGMKAL